MRVAVHGQPQEPEPKVWLEVAERPVGLYAPGQAVGHDPDHMAAPDLLLRKVEDVTVEAAQRSTEHVHHSRAARCRTNDSNSAMTAPAPRASPTVTRKPKRSVLQL